MWKLKHWLFGWDYILIRFGTGHYRRKIVKTFDGIYYINMDMLHYEPIKLTAETCKERDVMWLTCNPDKYIKE